MRILFLPILFGLLLCGMPALAQTDNYTGTWQMETTLVPGGPLLKISLQFAVPEKNILFPAHLTLQYRSFTGTYELLLVKKNSRELAISRNKFAEKETPFPIGNWLTSLVGVLDHSKDLKGNALFTLKRFVTKPPRQLTDDMLKIEEASRPIAIELRNFLQHGDVVLTKVNSAPWESDNRLAILADGKKPAYFGLKDSIHLPVRDGSIILSGNKGSGEDVVSVAVNGKLFMDQEPLGKKKHTEDIVLDTGSNIIVLFADQFGNDLPVKGKAEMIFGGRKHSMDFTVREDSAASFIVTKVYVDPGRIYENRFLNNAPRSGEGSGKKNEKVIADIVSTSRNLTFAIWDDAVEDGDTVSLNINGGWLVKGFPVKKAPQFIQVTLQPGPNVITFIADNLGSIPPNTSVLEIIEGKRRKSFFIETGLSENNLIKIFYDVKGDSQ